MFSSTLCLLLIFLLSFFTHMYQSGEEEESGCHLCVCFMTLSSECDGKDVRVIHKWGNFMWHVLISHSHTLSRTHRDTLASLYCQKLSVLCPCVCFCCVNVCVHADICCVSLAVNKILKWLFCALLKPFTFKNGRNADYNNSSVSKNSYWMKILLKLL